MNIRAPGYKHSAIAATVHAGRQSDELLNGGLGEGVGREKQSRIDARVDEAHAPVQVWAGGAAGLADRADHVAARDVLARLHVDALHVAVHGHQALAVVDEHGVAVEEVIAGRDHASRRGCAHEAPAAAATSRPLCGARGRPLKMRRRPNGLLKGPSAGSSNCSGTSTVSRNAAKAASSSCLSRSMRFKSSAVGATLRLSLMVRRCVSYRLSCTAKRCVVSAPSPLRIVMTCSPRALSSGRPTTAYHVSLSRITIVRCLLK